MDELETFAKLHGMPLMVGMKVRVSDNITKELQVWSGDFFVTGIVFLGRRNICDIRISRSLNGGCTDGWMASDLIPIEPSYDDYSIRGFGRMLSRGQLKTKFRFVSINGYIKVRVYQEQQHEGQ
jgi:hypothetical protein